MRRRFDQFLLAFLLLGHLVLLSAHERSKGSLLEGFVLGTIGPVVHLANAGIDGVFGFFDSFHMVGSLKTQNQQLRIELAELRQKVVRLQGVEEDLKRLASLSGTSYQRFGSDQFFVADVVFLDTDSWLRTLVLYTGDGRAKPNQPVVTDRGLVGRIVVATPQYAKVLLLIDRSASASAMILRTRRRGIIHGNGEHLTLDNIPLLADVEVGDEVVSAGIDGIFPRGIPIGTVESVEPGQGLFHRIRLTPAVDLSVLDQVFVLTEETLPTSVREAMPGDGVPPDGVPEGGAPEDGGLEDGEAEGGNTGDGNIGDGNTASEPTTTP